MFLTIDLCLIKLHGVCVCVCWEKKFVIISSGGLDLFEILKYYILIFASNPGFM